MVLALLSAFFSLIMLGTVLLLGGVLFMAGFDSTVPHERISALVVGGAIIGVVVVLVVSIIPVGRIKASKYRRFW